MKNFFTGPLFAITFFWFLAAMVLASIYGWIANFYWILAVSDGLTVQSFVAVIGLFVFPIGIVHGWIVTF